jgi:hypothetical protein
VRFEEIAESVLGRWSKPHVATLLQTALVDLKILLNNGITLLNVQPSDLAALSRKIKERLFRKSLFFFRNNCSSSC